MMHKDNESQKATILSNQDTKTRDLLNMLHHKKQYFYNILYHKKQYFYNILHHKKQCFCNITVLASTTVDLYFLHNFHLDSSEVV